jgi:hypothetical protein
VSAFLPAVRAESYVSHFLHDSDRHWPGTSCHVDLWIEVLSSLGRDPCAAMGFTVRHDFEGDQFTFLRIPAEDLDLLFGIDVQELVVHESIEEHVRERIGQGQMPLLEVDGFYLPDTRGISYRREHCKTMIGINRIDLDERSLEYFHNEGCFRLVGADFDGLLGWPPCAASMSSYRLPPYFEFAKLNTGYPQAALPNLAVDRLRHHMARAPAVNPFLSFSAILANLGQRLDGRESRYRQLAFLTTRQAGANFELMASHLRWIAKRKGPCAVSAIAAAASIAEGAKRLQFLMARALHAKAALRLDHAVDTLAAAYERLFEDLQRTFGRVETRNRLQPSPDLPIASGPARHSRNTSGGPARMGWPD